MTDITITEKCIGDVVVLELSGMIALDPEVELDSVTVFKEKIRSVLSFGKKQILVDLVGIRYIDSSGIGELVSSFTAAKNEKGVMKLSRLPQKIQDLLAIMKLLTIFDVFQSIEEGVSSFGTAKTF